MIPLHPLLAAVPPPAEKPVKLRLSASGIASLRREHPWVLAERVQSESRAGRAGDLAVVFDRKRSFVAVGLYDPHSYIRMRALRFRSPGPIDADWLRAGVATALERRAALAARSDTEGYRLVHGESDGLSGCVVDRYADTLVVKLYSHAWLPSLRDLVTALAERLAPQRVALRLSRQLAAQPEALHGLEDGSVIAGADLDGPILFRENGLRFEVDPVRGQKTGFFLDQRDNRARVEQLAAGARVLNAFAYSGGFSLYAARGGAREVVSLDQSRPALASAERNFALNRDVPAIAAARHRTLAGDAFRELPHLARRGERFELVILDPPAFARRKAQLAGALEAYARLARLGVGVLAPGGRIVLASCSAPVDRDAFRRAVCEGARSARRPLKILSEAGQPVDHPDDFAEGRYLDCLFAEA